MQSSSTKDFQHSDRHASGKRNVFQHLATPANAFYFFLSKVYLPHTIMSYFLFFVKKTALGCMRSRDDEVATNKKKYIFLKIAGLPTNPSPVTWVEGRDIVWGKSPVFAHFLLLSAGYNSEEKEGPAKVALLFTSCQRLPYSRSWTSHRQQAGPNTAIMSFLYPLFVHTIPSNTHSLVRSTGLPFCRTSKKSPSQLSRQHHHLTPPQTKEVFVGSRTGVYCSLSLLYLNTHTHRLRTRHISSTSTK